MVTFPRTCVDCGRDFLSEKRFDVLCPRCLVGEVSKITASLPPVEYEQYEADMAVERRGYRSDRAVGPESLPHVGLRRAQSDIVRQHQQQRETLGVDESAQRDLIDAGRGHLVKR